MEYGQCGSIRTLLNSGYVLNEEELMEVASCCLLGLNTLHKLNTIHRVSDLSLYMTDRTSSRTICSSQRVV